MTFNILRCGFAIRPAVADDAKACRMLLPQMSDVARCLVAVDGAQGLIIGAAAAARARRNKSPVGPGVAIHVIPPCRRCGVGTALVEGLVQIASANGDEAIYSAARVDMQGGDFAAWKALGFDVVETVEQHELDVAALTSRLTPVVDWLHEHGRIPPEARIMPLYAANREAVLQLHLAHLGGDRDALQDRLAGKAPEAFHPRYSRVLVIGKRVGGCVLAHRASPTVAAVDAVIVSPELRNDWASAWLRLEACRGAEAIGVTHLQFTSFDHYQDTRLFTAHLGGATTRSWALLARRVPRAGGR